MMPYSESVNFWMTGFWVGLFGLYTVAIVAAFGLVGVIIYKAVRA